MKRRAKTLVRLNLDELSLARQHGRRNFVLDVVAALQHMQQIAAQGAVLGGSLFPNPRGVVRRAANGAVALSPLVASVRSRGNSFLQESGFAA